MFVKRLSKPQFEEEASRVIVNLTVDHLKRLKEVNDLHIDLYENHLDRKWMANCFFPTLEGTTLNVGVDAYNELEELTFKIPANYASIDLIPENAKFGSGYSHQTIDLIQLRGKVHFNNLILFGVLEPPRGKTNLKYSMYRNSLRLPRIVEEVILEGGLVLLGPSLSYPRHRRVAPRWFMANLLLLQYFFTFYIRSNIRIVKTFYTQDNLVIVAKKRVKNV